MPHPADGSRCWASVCNKQWSADTEESPNYSRNANVSWLVRRSRSKSWAFDVRGGDRCSSRLETSGRSSFRGFSRRSALTSWLLHPHPVPLTSYSDENTRHRITRRSRVFGECVFGFGFIFISSTTTASVYTRSNPAASRIARLAMTKQSFALSGSTCDF